MHLCHKMHPLWAHPALLVTYASLLALALARLDVLPTSWWLPGAKQMAIAVQGSYYTLRQRMALGRVA